MGSIPPPESHTTFEAYCKERWAWSRVRAHQLIESAEITETLTTANTTLPTTERQARPLAKPAADAQPAAWDRANELAEEEGR